MTMIATTTLNNITHPAWCDLDRCVAEVNTDGTVEVLHTTADVPLEGCRVAFFDDRPKETGSVYAIAGNDLVPGINLEGEPDMMTPAQARAVAAALIRVADLVEGR